MAKTTNINIRTNSETKERVEKLFGSFGITVTDAINIFLHQSLMVGGFPFEVKRPPYNEETELLIKEVIELMVDKIQTKRDSSSPEIFKKLNDEMDIE